VVQSVLGGVSAGLIVMLASRIVPVPVAGLAGALYALSPTSLAYTPILATENLAIPLSLAAFLLLFVSQHKRDLARIRVLFLSGCLLGLTILVRPAAAFFVPAWAALAIYRPSPRQWLPLGLAPAVIGLAFVVAPWVSRNVGRGVGPIVSSVDGINLWMGNNDYAKDGGYCFLAPRCDQLTEREQEATYRRWAMRWISRHPVRYAQLCAIRAFRLIGPSSDYWAAIYLTPTRENDRANELAFVAGETGARIPQSVRDHSYRVVWRNSRVLYMWRLILTPFIFGGLLLSLVRWREYSIVFWPALTYILGISLTFSEVRFREMLDPFLFIPAAVLLWQAGYFYFVRSRQLAAKPSEPVAPRAG